MRKILLRLFYFLGIHHWARYSARNKIVVLCYHGFTPRTFSARKGGGGSGIENYQGKHLDVAIFQSQLDYLKKYYQVISLEKLLAYYERGTPLPAYSLAITIDDGYESGYKLAFPLLRERGMPAAIFITTDFVDRGAWLWVDRLEYAMDRTSSRRLELKIGGEIFSFDLSTDPAKKSADTKIRTQLKTVPADLREEILGGIEKSLGVRLSKEKAPEIYRPLAGPQIKEMIQSGLVTFGSHSVSHPILSRLSDPLLGEEVGKSRESIEGKTGTACRFFCYPNGREGDFNERTKKALGEAGYRAAFTTVEGMNEGRGDVFELKRIGVHEDPVEFVMTVSGVLTFLSKAKRTLLRFFPLIPPWTR